MCVKTNPGKVTGYLNKQSCEMYQLRRVIAKKVAEA